MKRKLSSYPVVIPVLGDDYVVGLQKQSNGKFKNVRMKIASLGAVQLLGKFTIDCNDGGAQALTISEKLGSKFVLSDMLFTNASADLTGTKDLSIQDIDSSVSVASTRNVAGTDLTFSNLVDASSAVNTLSRQSTTTTQYPRMTINEAQSVFGNNLEATIATPLGSAGTVDLYLFGYILE